MKSFKMRVRSAAMLLLCSTSLWASPVIKRTITVTQPDGTVLTLMPHGDEHGVWYSDTENNLWIQDESGAFVSVSAEIPLQNRVSTARQNRIGEMTIHEGSPRIPVILVSFADKDFLESDPKTAFTERLCKSATQSEVEAGEGSAYQYFVDQSYGKFTPQFDVIGPIKLSLAEAFYVGKEGEMVSEAVKLASESGLVPDWSVYDNNADGTVDASYVLFAGEGRHAHPTDMTLIWPQTSIFMNTVPQADGVKFYSYSCCNELLYGKIDGFGTFCHEFSHQLGLPDFYRTDGGVLSEFNMGPWSLMDYGGYNGDGFLPVGYRALEKWYMGWTEPVELNRAATVSNWSSADAPFKITSDVDEAEYYLLETIDHEGWNAACPAEGVLITHVYLPGGFGSRAWKENTLNNSSVPAVHVIAADNERLQLVTGVNDDAYKESIRHDLYPNAAGNDELTDTSTPAAETYVGLWGTMGKPVSGISYHADNGTASFLFMGGDDDNKITSVDSPVIAPEDLGKTSAEFWKIDGTSFTGRPSGSGFYIMRDAQGRTFKVCQ